MSDEIGTSQEEGQIEPPANEGEQKYNELTRRHERALKLGARFIAINEERIRGRFNFWINPERLNEDDIRTVREKLGPQSKEEDVLKALTASYGLTLEEARQIAQRQTEKPAGSGISENISNIEALIETIH